MHGHKSWSLQVPDCTWAFLITFSRLYNLILKILLIPETCMILPDNWKPVRTDALKATQGVTNYSFFLFFFWGDGCPFEEVYMVSDSDSHLVLPGRTMLSLWEYFGQLCQQVVLTMRAPWPSCPCLCQPHLSHNLRTETQFIKSCKIKTRGMFFSSMQFTSTTATNCCWDCKFRRIQEGSYWFLLSRDLTQLPWGSPLISMEKKKNRQSPQSHLQLWCSRTMNWVRFGHFR